MSTQATLPPATTHTDPRAALRRAYAAANYWERGFQTTRRHLLESWALITDAAGLEPRVWKFVDDQPHYKAVSSGMIGVYSVIKPMTVEGRTYTNKKGITKTSSDETFPAHFTEGGTYIGRVSALGEEPIPYPIDVRITPHHFRFAGVGQSIAECFEPREDVDVGERREPPQTKDLTRAYLWKYRHFVAKDVTLV
jgi:hypothetical protein